MTDSGCSRVGTRAEGLRERKRLETRRAIHEACLDLAEERGFHGFTVDEAAARAEISRRTFFNYFGSKEDAFFDIEADGLPEEYRTRYVSGAYLPPEGSVVEEMIRMYADVERNRLSGYRPGRLTRIREILKNNPKLVDYFIKKSESNFHERSELLRQRHPHLTEDERMIALKTVEAIRHIYIEHPGESRTYGAEKLLKTYDDVARLGFRPLGDSSDTKPQEKN